MSTPFTAIKVSDEFTYYHFFTVGHNSSEISDKHKERRKKERYKETERKKKKERFSHIWKQNSVAKIADDHLKKNLQSITWYIRNYWRANFGKVYAFICRNGNRWEIYLQNNGSIGRLKVQFLFTESNLQTQFYYLLQTTSAFLYSILPQCWFVFRTEHSSRINKRTFCWRRTCLNSCL